MGRIYLAAATVLALFALFGSAHAGGYRPRTVTATPFQNAPVTVYRDSRGRSVGTASQIGNVTIYRSR